MAEPYGYFNRLLRVNLSERAVSTFELPPAYCRQYVGGKGLGGRLLLDHRLHEREPLAPDNELIMLVGPLTGSLAPGVGKVSFYSRSPLTGGYLDSTCGGRLAHQFKSCGYDGLVITGRSEHPVYLHITDGGVRIEDAADLWGKGCYDTERALRRQYGHEPAVACIGPAGEHLVRYASVHADFYHQAGRGGMGALFGSHNLKAMVVHGGTQVPFFRPRELLAEQFRLIRENRTDQKVGFRIRYGTLSTLDLTQRLGCTVSRNFTDGVTDRYDADLNRDFIRRSFVTRNLACYGCPVPCGKASRFEHHGEVHRLGGPEYEAMSLIGSNLDVPALDLLYLNWLCDDLGMDTVSSGVTLSLATEAVERGHLTAGEFGFELKWGGTAEFARALRAIAFREGAGDWLAEGSKRFAELAGLDPDTAIHVKGMELPGYDPRGTTGYALAFAVADRGGCHRRARPIYQEQNDDAYRFAYEGKGALVRQLEDERAFYHSLIVCDFVPSVYPTKVAEYAEMLNLATGWDFDGAEARLVGERAINQNRLFNLRCGLGRQDDALPGRFFKESLPRGRSAGRVLEPDKFQRMLSDYYQARGWDENGVPTSEKLRELGIQGEVTA